MMQAIFQRIKLDIELRQFNSAMIRLTSISQSCSKSLEYLDSMAQVLRQQGQTNALVRVLKEINQLNPQPQVEIEIMQLLYRNGQINEALDIALRLLDFEAPQIDRTLICLTLIKIYIEENDFEGVGEVLEQQAAFLKEDDFICWAKGVVCIANNQQTRALQWFRKSVQLNYLNDQAWVSLALIHQEMGDRELALANLEKALDSNPLNATAVKMFSQWAKNEPHFMQRALRIVQFYLTQNDFDEELSLCHYQLLCALKLWRPAIYELKKLSLIHPQNKNYPEMQKKLRQQMELGLFGFD